MNLKNLFSLKKKLIILIGGDGLIGKKILSGLIHCGAKVIVIEKRVKKRKNRRNVLYHSIDIANLRNLENKIFELIKKFGVPDGVINCSYPKTNDWSKNNYKKVSLASFSKNIEIHLVSFIWIAKIFADAMKIRKKGSIVQLGSIYGSLGQDENLYHNTNLSESISYPVIKGGIINSVRSMASHYGKYNLRINSISPGGVEDGQSLKFIKRYTERTPLKRMARPDDVVGASLYLLSDASIYVSGTDLKVDGGWSSI